MFMSSWNVFCQPVVQRKSISDPVLSRLMGEPWPVFSLEKCHQGEVAVLGRCE